VLLVFTVANAGKETVTLHTMGRTPTADFRIADSQGKMVWTRLRGQTMLGALRLFPLAAGKSLTFRHSWDQRTDSGSQAKPGDYIVRGVLLTDEKDGLASPPARLRLER
jgi:hypothetical protein